MTGVRITRLDCPLSIVSHCFVQSLFCHCSLVTTTSTTKNSLQITLYIPMIRYIHISSKTIIISNASLKSLKSLGKKKAHGRGSFNNQLRKSNSYFFKFQRYYLPITVFWADMRLSFVIGHYGGKKVPVAFFFFFFFFEGGVSWCSQPIDPMPEI